MRNLASSSRRALGVPMALAVVASLAFQGTTLAQEESTMPAGSPNIVFVHGAWADGSSWSAEIEALQEQGFNVTAVQLPLSSVEEDVATVRRALELQTGPTILVAHSYGGAVVSQLGPDAPNVVGLVFTSAFMLDEGETVQGLLASGEPPPWLANLHPDSAGFLAWDEEGFMEYFAPDVDPVKARVLFAAQKPVNGAGFETVFGPPSWKAFPSWYLIGDQDQIIPPAAQELFSGRAGSTVSHVDAGHLALVSQPDAVVDVILQAVASMGSEASPQPS